MEETSLFVSNTECINVYIPEDADTDTSPVLYHSLFVYVALGLQNIFVRKNSEYQKPVHSDHIRTARSLWPSENHWGFLFFKNEVKIFKSKLVFHIYEANQLSLAHNT